MNYEPKTTTKSGKQKSKKNEVKKYLPTDKQKIQSKKGRKKEQAMDGIISYHEEYIRYVILLCKKGAMGEDLKTCQASLARFVTEKEILIRCINGEYKALKYSTIKTYISQIWNEEE